MRTIRTISSILLAMLVLVSSTSFIVGMHVCMGEVQNMAVFAKADGCEKEKQLPPCHRDTTPPCCEDETLTHVAEDLKVITSPVHVNPVDAADLEHTLALIAEIIPSPDRIANAYSHYIPPLLSTDLIVEHRVFLI